MSWAVTSNLASAMGTALLSRQSNARRSLRRAIAFPALMVTAFFIAACAAGNGLTSPATVDNVTRTYSVYAVTGTSSALPAAYQYSTETLVRPQLLASGALNFDIAFDITADGKARLLPAKYVVPLPPAGAPILGLQKMTAVYEQLTRAPLTGYTLDSAVTASVGETYTLQLRDSGCIYGDFFYAKLTIDSVIVSQRRIVLRSMVNRNCGYRSLTEGLPKD